MAKSNIKVQATNQNANKGSALAAQRKQLEIEHSYNPFPDVDDIERINKINPDLVVKMFNYLDKEQDFRHEQSDKKNEAIISEVNTSNFTKKLGMFFAFILFMTAMLISGYLILQDKIVTGSIFFGAVLLAAVGLFITGKVQRLEQDKE